SRVSWEHHHPKAPEPVAAARGVPEAGGTACEPLTEPVRTATQHTPNVVRSGQVFASIRRVVKVCEIRFHFIFPPQTPRPFPHVAAQVHDPIWLACSSRKAAHRTGRANTGLRCISFGRIKVLAPGIDPFIS